MQKHIQSHETLLPEILLSRLLVLEIKLHINYILTSSFKKYSELLSMCTILFLKKKRLTTRNNLGASYPKKALLEQMEQAIMGVG